MHCPVGGLLLCHQLTYRRLLIYDALRGFPDLPERLFFSVMSTLPDDKYLRHPKISQRYVNTYWFPSHGAKAGSPCSHPRIEDAAGITRKSTMHVIPRAGAQYAAPIRQCCTASQAWEFRYTMPAPHRRPLPCPR